MSEETNAWLHHNIRVGFTAPEYGRGPAWWANSADDPSQFPHAIPMEEAAKLLGFIVHEEEIRTKSGLPVPDKKAIVDFEDERVISVVGSNYKVHDYKEWLLDKVSVMLDGDLQIGSVGLLKNKGVAFAQVEMPNSVKTAGVEFRPFITAYTSLDYSMASEFKNGAQLVVCDNTLALARQEKTSRFIRRKHTAKSSLTATEMRAAFDIQLATIKDDYVSMIEELTNKPVSPYQFERFLDKYSPAPSSLTGRSYTMAQNKRARLEDLYFTDPRVAPWEGTAFGVLQATNTYNTHDRIVRNADRTERNYLNFIEGTTEEMDREAMRILDRVLV